MWQNFALQNWRQCVVIHLYIDTERKVQKPKREEEEDFTLDHWSVS